MIYQIGDDLPFQFAYIASKAGKTGLVVTVKRAYRNGVAIAALTGAAVTELGDGLYEYVMPGANVTAAGRYTVIATTADSTVDQQDLYAVDVVTPWVADVDAAVSSRSNLAVTDILSDSTAFAGASIAAILADSNELQGDWTNGGRLDLILDAVLEDTGTTLPGTLAAIQAKTDKIGTGTAMLVAPVKANGDVDIIRGDSYLNADLRALNWTDTTWSLAATSAFIVIVQDVCVFTGSRVSATQGRLELTSAQTLTLPEGVYDFSFQEVQAGGERLTHLQGVWTVETRPYPTS